MEKDVLVGIFSAGDRISSDSASLSAQCRGHGTGNESVRRQGPVSTSFLVTACPAGGLVVVRMIDSDGGVVDRCRVTASTVLGVVSCTCVFANERNDQSTRVGVTTSTRGAGNRTELIVCDLLACGLTELGCHLAV
jgi:hypothetical protein